MAIFLDVWERQTVYIPEMRERPKNSLENCSARFLPDRPTVKSYPLDQSAKRPRMRYLSPRHVQELDRLLFCVGSASKAVLQMTCSLAWTRARLKKVDTVAQFWLANQGDRLQRMQKWQFLHPTPYPEPISKDVYHDLFEYLGLNEGIVQNYFLARAKRCHKKRTRLLLTLQPSLLIPDTLRKLVRALIKPVTVWTPLSFLHCSIWQRISRLLLHANRETWPMFSGIENALKQFSFLNISKAQIVTDKGYYSRSNIGQMLRKHIKFLTAASTDLLGSTTTFKKIKTAWKQPPVSVPGTSISMESQFPSMPSLLIRDSATEVKQPRAILLVTRRLYLHLYLNRERVGEDEKRLATDLMSLKSDIEKGLWDELSESAQKKAEKYLNTKSARQRRQAQSYDKRRSLRSGQERLRLLCPCL